MKHIHKLKKHTYKNTGNSVFFCVLDCNFKIEAPFALGKEVLCNVCGEPFTMNEYSIKLKFPHCMNCGKTKIKDADGKERFVKKRAGRVMSDVAADEVKSLRERLDGLTGSEGDI